MSLHTRICDIFGIEYPIVLAGMGGASAPRLAAAVSNAGGLGILGAAGCGPELLKRWIDETRSLTDKPFGVDTLLPASVRRMSNKPGASGAPSPMDNIEEYKRFRDEFMKAEGLEMPEAPPQSRGGGNRAGGMFSKDFFASQMEVVIAEEVPVYAAGLGDPGPYVEQLHANGTKVLSVVGAVRHARKCVDSGVDVIVAQGHDAGGHNSPVGTVALVPQVVDAAGKIPVLAAGGITDGRGVAAAMMLGAEGVWIGTRFLATDEANLADFQKKAIVEGTEEGTMVSKSVTGKPARLIRNKWSEAFAESGLEPLPMPFQSIISGPVQAAGLAQERQDITPGFAGQGMGMIRGIAPAADVLREIVRETEEALKRAARFL
jgi:nitronate monooxygenase